MNASFTAIGSRTTLSNWERALMVLPALTGLFLGSVLVFLPATFAAVGQFPADDTYIYQLGGAATLGYGVGFTIGLFQRQWLWVRLAVVGLLVFQLGSLFACLATILTGPAPYSVYLILGSSLLFIGIASLLLVRHRGVPRPQNELTTPGMRFYLIVGAVAAGVFGLLPLFVPNLFTFFHLKINAPFIIRQAGAASLGYAVIAVMAQQALNSQEFPLIMVMAAVFNGVGGLVSIPYLVAGNILLLPWVITPVGLVVMVVCLILLRQNLAGERANSVRGPRQGAH